MSDSLVIDISNISKYFKTGFFGRKNTIQALKNISLQVKKGEVFGLLGTNGAGKTTLIRILLGLLRPSNGGYASIFGYDVTKESLKVRKKVALLPQEASCYENLTARENILYYGGMNGQLSNDQLNRRTDELIELIGLRDRANDVTKEFSGGMKRKVLVARALVADPDLIFLDEPTTGIDILGARVIRNLIKRLSKELHKTIFLTTHDLTDLTELCDRVGIIHHGKLIAVGKPEELEEKFKASGLEDLFIGLTTGEIDFE
ncbi:MAG: ABC transporter ATP-binding protein [Candidatus Hodarchaeales archaeon]|jgi:ABC-2 type transport system ATP-binding protein